MSGNKAESKGSEKPEDGRGRPSAVEYLVDGSILQEEETRLRTKVANSITSNVFVRLCLNLYSSLLVFFFYLLSLESILSIALAVTMTICELRNIFSLSNLLYCLEMCGGESNYVLTPALFLPHCRYLLSSCK